MIENQDIFDRIMQLPIIKVFNPFYRKHKEVLLYLFFGGISFLISIGTYVWFNIVFGMNELIANILSWIITVMFAFLTNRIWVFHAETAKTAEFIRQMISFYGGRVITLALEEIILLVFITWLAFSSIPVKVIAQIMVIILNYVISKIYIFKKK